METAKLPQGWRDRLIPIRTVGTGDATGLCLDVHDLAVSKLAAGREKDLEYLKALLRHRLAKPDLIASRLAATAIDRAARDACERRLKAITAAASRT